MTALLLLYPIIQPKLFQIFPLFFSGFNKDSAFKCNCLGFLFCIITIFFAIAFIASFLNKTKAEKKLQELDESHNVGKAITMVGTVLTILLVLFLKLRSKLFQIFPVLSGIKGEVIIVLETFATLLGLLTIFSIIGLFGTLSKKDNRKSDIAK